MRGRRSRERRDHAAGVHGHALQHDGSAGPGPLSDRRRHGDAGEQRLPVGVRDAHDPGQGGIGHHHGAGERRHQVRGQRDVPGQPERADQRHDRADGQGQGTIQNDDTPPNLAIGDVKVVEGNAGSTVAVFTLTLSNTTDQPVSVDYQTVDNTATLANSDYVETTGTVTIPPKTLTGTLTVKVLGDTKFENDETFFVNLSNGVNATIVDAQGIRTISNDDNPPSVSINDVKVVEGNGGNGRGRPHGQPVQHHRPVGDGELADRRRFGNGGQQRLPAGERQLEDRARDVLGHDHGAGERRRHGGGERGVRRQPVGRPQCVDRGRARRRDDLERRWSAVAHDRRREGDRGERGAGGRDVHGEPHQPQQLDGDGELADPRRIGHGRQQRLRRRERDADVRAQVDGAADDLRNGER